MGLMAGSGVRDGGGCGHRGSGRVSAARGASPTVQGTVTIRGICGFRAANELSWFCRDRHRQTKWHFRF